LKKKEIEISVRHIVMVNVTSWITLKGVTAHPHPSFSYSLMAEVEIHIWTKQ